MPRTMDEINLYQGTLRNFRIKRQRENHINYKRKKMVSLIERVRAGKPRANYAKQGGQRNETSSSGMKKE